MRYLRYFVFSCALVSLAACSNGLESIPTSQVDNQNSEEANGQIEDLQWPELDWDNQNPNSQDWNQYAFDGVSQLGSGLTSTAPSDIQRFCPNYLQLNEDEKKFFWISLIAAMARFESGFRPETQFQESFRDRNGNFIISRGLLQLSMESSLGYGCPLNTEEELHKPKVNIECSVRILNRWIERDKVITARPSGNWRGGARYWAVLRKESTLNRVAATTSQSELCR